MPQDLFANLQQTQQTTQGPRDLFAGMSPQPNNPPNPQQMAAAQQVSSLGASPNPAAAAIAGLSNAGANLLEGGVDSLTWLGQKLGAINPALAQAMKEHVNKDMNTWFRSNDQTPRGDVFNESRMAYPAISAVSQAAPEVLIASKAIPSSVAPFASSGANLATNLFLQSGGGALMGAGMAGPDTNAQDKAALMGFAIPLAVNLLGAGAVNYAQKMTANQHIKDIMTQLDAGTPEHQIVQNIFGNLTNDPANFNQKNALYQLNQIIDKTDDKLSPSTISTLQGIKKLLTGAGVTPTANASSEVSNALWNAAAGAIGAGIGAHLGPGGAVVGATVGAAARPTIINTVNSLMSTPMGMSVLKGIGDGNYWAQLASQLLKGGTVLGVAKKYKNESQ